MADDLFASHLLKLQETHLQMVKKLKDEVELLTTKCQTMQTCANQNAFWAKKYYTKSKLLLNDREIMKAKMKQLVMKDRMCKRCKALKDQQKAHLDMPTETKSPSPVLAFANESKLSPVMKRKSKLRRKKDINTDDVVMLGSPVMSTYSRGENVKEISTDEKLLNPKNIGKEKNDASDCDIDEGQHEIVFVLETFAPDMSLNSSYDRSIPVIDALDFRTPDVKGINERTKITGVEKLAIMIPDTCAFEEDDDVIVLNTHGHLLKSPLSSSTQIVPQLTDDLPNLNVGKSPQVEDDDLTMIHTQDTVLKVPQFSSTPTIPKLKKQQPLVDTNQQKNMENHLKRRGNRRSSLPKSESQYPVDLVNTQIPSPTFQRDISAALTKEDEEKDASINLTFLPQKTPTSDVRKTPVALQETPKSAVQKTPTSFAQQTPPSAQKDNESYLSDASPLLLRDFQRTTFVNKTCNRPEEVGEISFISKKRKFADVHNEYGKPKSANTLERNGQDDIEQELNRQKKSKNSPTKHKLVQKTLGAFNGSKANANSGGFSKRYVCSGDDTQNDIYFKRAIEESLQEQKMLEFKKPFIPIHKRTPSGDSFLNGTIDPAIDLTEFEDNTPKEVTNRTTSNQKPTSIVMTSGTVCIVKEVPYIPENVSTGELIKELPAQGIHLDDEDDNRSHDDMFSADEELEEGDISYNQDDDDPDIYDETTDEKPTKLPVNSFLKNFDALPSADEKPQYKYVEVVRKQADRRKLRGFECKDCEVYFSTMDLTDAQKAERMKSCSRHRGHHSPPSTQPHYWDVDFPDTETCLRRGYINNAPEVKVQDETRKPLGRRRKYKQNFKSKTSSASNQ